tara:strand:+ start:116 stop:505 length:390 start_codon:yes stop_codon:yes gene_type:complete
MEEERIELLERLKPLSRTNIYFVECFEEILEPVPGRPGEMQSIHWEQRLKEFTEGDIEVFKDVVEKLEAAKIVVDKRIEDEKPIMQRRMAYPMIDHLLLEALAEKEEGRPEKMQAYLIERQKIKDQYPI